MSIFTNNNIPLKDNVKPDLVSFSNIAKSPILAIAVKDKVYFYNDKLARSENVIYNENDIIWILKWNPGNLDLIIGYSSGNLGLYNFLDNKFKLINNIHSKEIIHINFNSSGSLMLVSDKWGKVSFWREFNCLNKENFDAPITNSIFIKFKHKKENKANKWIPLIFIGDKLGKILYCMERKKDLEFTELFQANGSIKSLMYHKDSQSIIIITSTMLYIQVEISSSSVIKPTKKVKWSINSKLENLNISWMDPNMFSIVSSEKIIRIWNVENDEYYNLNYNELDQVRGKAIKSCFDYNSCNLFVGTNKNYIIGYKINSNFNNPNSEDWKLFKTFIKLDSPIKEICNHISGLIAIRTDDNVSILRINELQSLIYEDRVYNQSRINEIEIYKYPFKESKAITFENNIKSFDYFNNKILIYTGRKIEVYNIIKFNNIEKITQIEILGKFIYISRMGIIVINNFNIKIYNLEGNLNFEVNLSLLEGEVIVCSKIKEFILLYTKKGFLKLIDLNKQDFNIKTENIPLNQILKDFKYLKNINISFDGKKVLILYKNKNNWLNLVVYSFDNKRIIEYEFKKENDIIKRIFKVYWDQTDKNSFCIYGYNKNNNNIIVSFLISEKNKIVINEIYKLDYDYENIIGFYSPYYIAGYKTSLKYLWHAIKSNIYESIDTNNPKEVESMKNFNYYSTIGSIEKAYNSIKYFNNSHLWKDLFKLSVKSKRLDIAEISIGNMKFARAAQNLREEKNKNSDKISKLATLCVQLNLIDEAVDLLMENNNYDKIIEIYIVLGKWKEAEELCERKERINLKLLYFKWAKYYENQKNYDKAIEIYEKLENSSENIYKMLIKNNNISRLIEYGVTNNNTLIYNYIGYYFQKRNEVEKSVEYFEKAKNYKKVVENYISMSKIDKAINLCNSTNDPGACLLLSENYELEDNNEESIKYLIKGKLFYKALKILNSNNDDERYFSIALQSPFYAQNMAAKYFLKKNFKEKAVQLLINCKQYKKALDISLKNNFNDYINKITSLISEHKTNTGSINKLLKLGEYSKAFALMVAENKIKESVTLLKDYQFEIGIEHVDKIKEEFKNHFNDDEKNDVYLILAKKLKQSGKYLAAQQTYISIGKHLKGFKCLLKEGNIEKIIKFANLSRKNEILIMAADHLQSGNLKSTEIYQNIIKMYNKAKAYNKIATFLLNYSIIELQDYDNWDNCLLSLKESKNYIDKIEDNEELLKRNIYNIDILNKYQELLNNEDINGLRELLQENLGDILLKGNLFSKIIKYNIKWKNYEAAYNTVLEMKNYNIQINNYFKQSDIEELCKLVNKPINTLYEEEEELDGSEIYEDIEENIDED